MYYDDSKRHDEVKQQLNTIWYFDWTYYYDESNKHNEENKTIEYGTTSIEYIALNVISTRERTDNL